MAKKDPTRVLRPDETLRGGAFLVDGVWVNAFGQRLTKEQIAEHESLLAKKQAAQDAEAAGLPAESVLSADELKAADDAQDDEDEPMAPSAKKRAAKVTKSQKGK